MASKTRKRTLPPWLCGVAVSKKGSESKGKGPEALVEQRQSSSSSKIKKVESFDRPDATANHDVVNMDRKKQKLCSQTEGEVDKVTQENKNKTDEAKTPQNIDDIIAMSYKEYIFAGSLIYSHNMDDCNLLCDDIISELTDSSDHVIGFDTEWPVTYVSGQQTKTALVQVCTSVDKCYLFHISCMPKFPVMLKKLLEMKNVKKVGLNIEVDMWKLEMGYDFKAKEIIQTSCVELSSFANKKLRSAEKWSLEGLVRNVLRLRISKDQDVRKCDWSQYPLSKTQQLYAATDAAVSLMLYNKLR